MKSRDAGIKTWNGWMGSFGQCQQCCCALLGTELRAVGHRGGACIKHHSSEAVHVPKVKMTD